MSSSGSVLRSAPDGTDLPSEIDAEATGESASLDGARPRQAVSGGFAQHGVVDVAAPGPSEVGQVVGRGRSAAAAHPATGSAPMDRGVAPGYAGRSQVG
jgi:hypothetical protein